MSRYDVPGLDLERLNRDLEEHRPGLVGGDLHTEVVQGGRSNLSYIVGDHDSRWVLRRPPLGHVLPTAHDMAREYRAIDAQHGTASVPVPPPGGRPVLLGPRQRHSPLDQRMNKLQQKIEASWCPRRTHRPPGRHGRCRRAPGLARRLLRHRRRDPRGRRYRRDGLSRNHQRGVAPGQPVMPVLPWLPHPADDRRTGCPLQSYA